MPFDWAVQQAFVLNGEPEKSGIPELLLEFFRGRLQHHLTAAGHSPDVVEAVLSARLEKKRADYVPGTKALFSWDIAGISSRVEVLSEGKKRDDFLPLATTFKRVVNIIPTESPGPPVLDLGDLTEPAEVRLVDAFDEVGKRSRELIGSREYEKLFAELRKLKAPVDRFFDQVRVLDSDKPQLMAQRIALLRRIADLFYEIADFSKIYIEQDVRSSKT